MTGHVSTDPKAGATPGRQSPGVDAAGSACWGGVVAMPGPAAFMSYVRFDDRHDDGWLTRFRERLSAEVRAQTGNDFAIFQDRNDIYWGQNWQQRINEALDTVTLLLVIITPSLFRSSACRAEVNKFLDRERALGRGDLILPVYYIGAQEMDDPTLRATDDLAMVLASRQLADWRELRLKPITSPQVRKAIAQLASRMRDTFWQPPAASTARPGGRGQTAESPAMLGGQAGGADRVAAKTEAASEERPVAISGRRTDVYLVEGDGETVLEPQHTTISLRSSKIDLPPIIVELRQHIVARLEASRPPAGGGVAMWNSPYMATLTGYRRSRTPIHEHVVMNLDMNVTDYATFAATVLSLDSEIEKVTQDGLPVKTTLRHEYFPTSTDASRAVNKPVPFLANGVGVVLLAFTDDDEVILTRRRDSSRARPGQRDVSVVEGIHTIHDATGSNRVDAYLTAIRACREELGVSVTNNDVQLLGFGVDMKYYQWNFFGTVELRCTSDDAMELHAMNAKDRWEGQLQAVAANPVTVFQQLHSDRTWDTALVATYLAFCKRIGVARTRRAAAQVFGGNRSDSAGGLAGCGRVSDLSDLDRR
jgi:TIR domain